VCTPGFGGTVPLVFTFTMATFPNKKAKVILLVFEPAASGKETQIEPWFSNT
jgi:hypothetical protein